MNPNNEGAKVCCKCGHHKIAPVAVMLFGFSFLLVNINVLSWYDFGIIWPLLLIAAASGKLCRCCHQG